MGRTRMSRWMVFVARLGSSDYSVRGRVVLCGLAILAALVAVPCGSRAASPALTIANGSDERQLTAAELLARPDSAVLNVTGDVYHGAVHYRAVPLLALLGSPPDKQFDTLEVRASDGFVSQIPLALVARGASGGAVAWIAVEDPAAPWPSLPHGSGSAGPFYLVWEHPERSGVGREQWPYNVVRISVAENPLLRWPQLAAPNKLSTVSSVRKGQDVFVVDCLPCHRLNGGGASEFGPDLNQPMSPTQYLSKAGLRALIRDPKAVRTWPDQHMMGFSKAVLPDADLDALIAYLGAMAEASGHPAHP